MAEKLPIPWPGPIRPERDPVSAQEAMAGHPTAPGFREPYVAVHGRQDVRDGSPGIPRVWPGRRGPLGIPGSGTGTPTQPDIFYDGPFED